MLSFCSKIFVHYGLPTHDIFHYMKMVRKMYPVEDRHNFHRIIKVWSAQDQATHDNMSC